MFITKVSGWKLIVICFKCVKVHQAKLKCYFSPKLWLRYCLLLIYIVFYWCVVCA